MVRRLDIKKLVLVFPTWIVAEVLHPFLPSNHIWKDQMPSLIKWAWGATKLNEWLGTGLWLSGLYTLIMFFMVV